MSAEHKENTNSLDQLLEQKGEAFQRLNNMFNDLTTKKFDRQDVMKALYNVREIIFLQDQLLNASLNDLVIVANRFSSVEQQLFQFQQQLATLSTVLEDNNVITKENVKKAWEEKVKPALQAHLKKLSEQVNESEKGQETLPSESPPSQATDPEPPS